MIAPDKASDLEPGRRFDIVAALLIGTIAVLASLLAVIEVGAGQRATRARMEAARLTADVSAGLQVSTLVGQAVASEQESALVLAMEGSSRSLAGAEQGDDVAWLMGSAQAEAASALSEALTATAATASGPPVDAYTARLVQTTLDELTAEVAEQNNQVDLAEEASARNTRAVLGLSFLALGGVLAGLGVVLRKGRAGWFLLVVAAGMITAAGVMALLAVV